MESLANLANWAKPVGSHLNLFLDNPNGLSDDTKAKYEVRESYTGKGVIISQKTFLNEIKHGVWTWRHNNEMLKSQKIYVNGDLHGTKIIWHKNGKIKHVSTNIKGHLHGEIVFWNENGACTHYYIYIRSKCVYQRVYLDNINNSSKPESYRYVENGDYEKSRKLLMINRLSRCKLWGSRLSQYQISTLGIFRENLWNIFPDKKDTRYILDVREKYNQNGSVISQESYLNTKKHGVWTSWYPSGYSKKKEIYTNGLLHGCQKMWHPNGVLESCFFYVSGKKHGKMRNWNSDGECTSFHIYIEGSLVYYRYYISNITDNTIDNICRTRLLSDIKKTKKGVYYQKGGTYGYKKSIQMLKKSSFNKIIQRMG